MHACASSIIGGHPSRTVRGTSRRIRPSGWPIERRWPIEAVLGRWPIESECEFLSNCRAGPHEPLVSLSLSLPLPLAYPSGRGTIQHLNLSSPLRNFGPRGKRSSRWETHPSRRMRARCPCRSLCARVRTPPRSWRRLTLGRRRLTLPDAKGAWSLAMTGNLRCRRLSCVTQCRA